MLADAERAAIQERVDKATPGPWELAANGPWIGAGDYAYDEVLAPAQVQCMAYCYGGSSQIEISEADREFIASARTDIPALLAALKEAEAERDRLRAVVERVEAVVEELDSHGQAPEKFYYGAKLRAALDNQPKEDQT